MMRKIRFLSSVSTSVADNTEEVMSASEPSDTISLGRRFFPSCGDSSSSGTISTELFKE
jgi:hypothetical protein